MVISLLALMVANGSAVEGESAHSDGAPKGDIRAPAEVGQGFAKYTAELKLSRAFGTTETGSNRSHDLWLTQVQGGLMLTDVVAQNWWFGGNVEGIAQLLAGGQDNPEAAYFVGLNGGLRYHLRTGTRLNPFVSGSIGVASTDIGGPDLSGSFQFNEQIGAGFRYFITEQYAISLEYAFWHVSNGGIREPNDGVNAHLVSLGVAWIF